MIFYAPISSSYIEIIFLNFILDDLMLKAFCRKLLSFFFTSFGLLNLERNKKEYLNYKTQIMIFLLSLVLHISYFY